MKIAVIVTARPSWAKLQTLCEALKAKPEVELQIVACASALLERYGNVANVIKAQGFSITEEIYSVIEGENTRTSAQETGGLLNLLAPVLSRLRCDVVVGCADRHEVLAVAQAAAYQHIPFGHVQGGEHTGSIDDRVRNAITQLADYHFTATEQAKYRVASLTGAYDRVWNVGCPSIDVAKRAQLEAPVSAEELGGAGVVLDMCRPFAVVLQHPVTSEADESFRQMHRTLIGVLHARIRPLVMWPGQDAGASGASKAIRMSESWLSPHTLRNLPPNRFLKLLTQASVLIGNSSAGIRECSYLGVPVVNVGSRQHGRQRGPNVIDVQHDDAQITAAIEQQIAHGPYASSGLYGRGDAGQQIAERLIDACIGSYSRETAQQGLPR